MFWCLPPPGRDDDDDNSASDGVAEGTDETKTGWGSNSSSREGAARSSFINLPQVLPTILDHPSHAHVRVALAGKARRCYIISQSLVVSCILSYSLRSAVHACNARSPCDRSSSTREAQPSRCTTTTVKIPAANRCKSSTSEASIRERTFFQSRPSSCACDEPLHKRAVQVELTNPERYGGFLFFLLLFDFFLSKIPDS